MRYINLYREIIEELGDNQLATNREEFEQGGFVELPEDFDIDDMDLIDLFFPYPSPYEKYAYKDNIITLPSWSNKTGYSIGESIDDYKAGKAVKLNNFQLKWYEKHIDATPIEVLKMGYDLDSRKQKKLAELTEYDNSEGVNSFIINGFNAWLTVPERTNYNTSITAAELLGKNEVTFLIGGKVLTVLTSRAKQMLAAVQLYADACYIVTQSHVANINELTDIDEVMAYDFTQGYPEKLVFTI